MAAVKELCTKAIMLKNGELHSQGLVDDLVTEYTINNSFKSEYNFDKVNDPLYINQIFINPTKGNLLTISSGTSFLINFHLNKTNIDLAVTIGVSSINDVVIFHHGHWMYENKDATNGDYQLEIKLPPHTLNAGMYKMTLIFAENYHDALLVQKDIEFFEIENEAIARNARVLPGVLRPNLEYSVNKI
jgi:lipopolysaccharide transport system ATP-binding protein